MPGSPTSRYRAERLVIGCLATPYIANSDDLDPLELEPGVDHRMTSPGRSIPAEALVTLAGSKATIADLHALRREGAEREVQLDNDGLIPITGR